MATETVGFNLPILQPVSITSGPVVSVSQFGAVGDGRTNDTAAIQSALNYVKAHGGTLNFAAGHTYIISKSLVISGASDFKIDGNGATIKMANGTPVQPGYMILRIDSSDHFAVTELTLDGNRANRSPAEVSAHNVNIKDSQDFSFSHVNSINAVTDGFRLYASDQTDQSTYTRNGLFLECRADNSFRQGMTIVNGENIQVIGGAYTNTHGTEPSAGIDVESNAGTALPGNHNILIRGATFSGNDGYGVVLSVNGHPRNITVEQSHFANDDLGAIKVSSSETLIQHNDFDNFSHSEHGVIYLSGVQTNSDNTITENSFNHIHTGQAVVYAATYSGTDNQVYGNKYYDIDGPFLQSKTTGTTGWTNVLTTSATDSTTPSDAVLIVTADPALTSDASTTSDPSSATSDPVINGTSGDDHLVATANPDTINGYAGTDRISYLNSTAGVTVKLSSGTGAGGYAHGDTLHSIENVLGSHHSDVLVGSSGNNVLAGADDNDVLRGLGGNDTLVGGGGNNVLVGGHGNDHIDASHGNSIVHYNSPLDGHDLITGFDGNGTGGQDKLDLDSLFDSLHVSTGARAGRVEISAGNHTGTVNVHVDVSPAHDASHLVTVATLALTHSSDHITVGHDVIVGTG